MSEVEILPRTMHRQYECGHLVDTGVPSKHLINLMIPLGTMGLCPECAAVPVASVRDAQVILYVPRKWASRGTWARIKRGSRSQDGLVSALRDIGAW